MSPAPPRYATAGPLAVANMPWNLSMTDVGKVSAMTELSADVIVYGSKGASVFAGGTLAANDPTVTSWTAATTIPAADGTGTWAVSIDGHGAPERLVAFSSVENIADRYGLLGTTVHGIAALDGVRVGFALDAAVVVSLGTEALRFDDGGLLGLVGGGGRLAGLGADGRVHVLDPAAQKLRIYPTSDAVGVAFGLDGKLYAITAHTLWVEEQGALVALYTDPAAPLHGLVASGDRIWVGAGSELLSLLGNTLGRTVGLGLGADATLATSPSGDVWELSSGTLARYGIPVTGDEATWRNTVLPVYARSCSSCHGPGGTSGYPLATYAEWVALRDLVYQRVVVKADMPQGRTISDTDKQAIADWSRPASP